MYVRMHVSCVTINCNIIYRYEMMENTWHEEPEKRPSFTDIVQFLQGQNIEDTPVDETESTVHVIIETKNDNSYLDLS